MTSRRAKVGRPVVEIPPVRAVLVPIGVPEREVLRVEGSFGNDGSVGYRRPVDPIRRLERQQAIGNLGLGLVIHHHRLVNRIRSAEGIFVLEHRDVGGVDERASLRPSDQDDIVVFAAANLVQPQGRFHPVDAVVALGIARKVVLADADAILERRQVPGLVVHPVEIAVAKDAVITTAAPFPGCVMDHDDFLGDRMVQFDPGPAGKRFHQVSIDEQLAPRPDRNRIGRKRGRCDGDRKGRQAEKHRSSHDRSSLVRPGIAESRWNAVSPINEERP